MSCKQKYYDITTLIGQLPIQTDVDEIPQGIFMKSTPGTPSKLPPPIPPKSVKSIYTLDATCDYDHDNEPPDVPRKSANQPALPPLPPKYVVLLSVIQNYNYVSLFSSYRHTK